MIINKNSNVLLVFNIAEGVKAYASFWYEASFDDTTNASKISINKIYFNHDVRAGDFHINANMYLDDELFCSLNGGSVTIVEPGVKAEVITDDFPAIPFVSPEIDHNTLDKKEVVLRIDATIHDYIATYEWSATSSVAIDLTDYSQIASANAVEFYIGQAYSIILNSYKPEYKYVIKYNFGDLSGYVGYGGVVAEKEEMLLGQIHTFRVPTSFYSQIPESQSGICIITVYTYLDDTLLGSASTGHHTRIWGQTCAPVVLATIEDVNEISLGLTSDKSKFVKYRSTALVSVQAHSDYDSPIKSVTVNGISVDENGVVRIEGIDSDIVKIVATDSRGVSTTKEINIELIPYILLTSSLSAKRDAPTSGDATLTVSGNYFNNKFGNNPSALENELLLSYSIVGDNGVTSEEVAIFPAIIGNSYTASASLSGLDYDKSHTIQVTATDKTGVVRSRVVVKQGIPVFEWGKDDFTVNKKLRVNSLEDLIIGGSTLLDYLHPIGSLYVSSDSTNPEEIFGGKWEQITDTFILAAGNTYLVNEIGGSTSHTLTQEEMPYHYHDMYVSGVDESISSNTETSHSYIGAIKNEAIQYDFNNGIPDVVRLGMTAFKGGTENEDGTGSVSSFDKMPPYIVKYVWERIA